MFSVSVRRENEFMKDSGINLFKNIPFNNDKAPIIMHTRCCSMVKGTNFKALPPN